MTFASGPTLAPLVVLIGGLAYLLAFAADRIRVRVSRGRPLPRGRASRIVSVPRMLPLFGLALAAGSPAVAGTRGHRTQDSSDSVSAPPWSDPADWTPHLSAGSSSPIASPDGDRSYAGPHEAAAESETVGERLRAHPAVHPPAGGDRSPVPSGPLFPRASAAGGSTPTQRHSRHDRVQGKTRYEVMLGDCLWAIAQRELGTDDVAQIDAYWQQIYKLNRDVLGKDPSLIYPGSVLELPAHDAG